MRVFLLIISVILHGLLLWLLIVQAINTNKLIGRVIKKIEEGDDYEQKGQ